MSLDALFNAEPGPPSFVIGVLGFVYLVLLAASILLARYNDRLTADNRLTKALISRVSLIGTVLGAVGVASVVLRYAQVPVLSARIIVYVVVTITSLLVIYAVYYVRSVFPRRLSRYQAEELQRRYLPKQKGHPSGASPRVVRNQRKGKRRR